MTPLIEEQLEAFFRAHYREGLVADVGAGKDDKVDAALRRVIKKEPSDEPTRIQRFGIGVSWPGNTHGHDITLGPLPWTYDTVVTCDLLEHVVNPTAAANNIMAALKPGGWLYVTTVFAFEHHEYPIDMWRFTTTALEYLFCRFPDDPHDAMIRIERCWYEEESPHPDFGRRWRVSLVGQRV